MINKPPIPQPLVLREFPSLSRKAHEGRESSWRFRLIKRKTPAGIRTHFDIREYEANNRAAVFTQHGVYFTPEEIPFVILNLQKALEEIRHGRNGGSGDKDFSNNQGEAKLL